MTRRKMTAKEQEAAREQFLIATEGMAERSRQRQKELAIELEQLKRELAESINSNVNKE